MWCLLIWAASWFFDVRMLGFSESSEFWTRFTYLLAHVGVIHMFLNILFIDLLLSNLRRWIYPDRLLAVAVTGAVLATFGAEASLPTIGASGVLYFILGAYTAYRFNAAVLFSVTMIALLNVFILSAGTTNVAVHALGFIYGLLFALTHTILTKIKTNHGQKKRKAQGDTAPHGE